MSAREVAERLRQRRIRGEVTTEEGQLYVRGLSGRERDEYYRWIRSTADSGESVMLSDHRIVALAMVDERGAPMFESVEQGLEVIADFNSDDTTRLAKEVLRLSGMQRGAAEDAEKKS
jgi:hypothetical protein